MTKPPMSYAAPQSLSMKRDTTPARPRGTVVFGVLKRFILPRGRAFGGRARRQRG